MATRNNRLDKLESLLQQQRNARVYSDEEILTKLGLPLNTPREKLPEICFKFMHGVSNGNTD